MYPKLNGSSNETGFVINNGRVPIASTQEYEKEFEEEVPDTSSLWSKFLLWSPLIVFAVAYSPSVWLIIKAGSGFLPIFLSLVCAFLASVALSYTVFIFVVGMTFGLYEAGWHGVEHMVLECLNKGRSPTLHNLKRESKWMSRCGTMIRPIITSLLVVALFSFSGMAVQFISETLESILALAILLLVTLGAALMQHYFTTAHPDENQLKEALLVLREAHGKLQIIYNTKTPS